ncbi:MAG: circadian clock protein KaiC [Acidobacteriota bacterium]|jgi:circadian clock protein KaiC|nr:circadian clock protein KaiC [Acidobacteriota bacterium]
MKRELAPTGIQGLDDVLGGGLTQNRIYLVMGDPGVGKTTLGLHFLLEGARRGEKVLYIALSETREEIEAVAESHGWSLEQVEIFEYSAANKLDDSDETTLFHPSEMELGEATRKMMDAVERVKPNRVVIDSLAEVRLLAQSALRYRRQILGLKHYFSGRQTTVLLLDDRDAASGDMQLLTLAHGVLMLEQLAPLYGSERRRIRVSKMRGVKYRGGFHDVIIRTGGLVVFPRLIASEHRAEPKKGRLESGIAAIDALLGGGIDRGTSTLLMGPAGSGKSTLAAQYGVAAAERGENVAMFLFDESRTTLLARCDGIGLAMREQLDHGRIAIQQIDPAEVPPGEFVQLVREQVEQRDITVLVIDSLNGYVNAMPEERFLTIHMHELLTYLGQHGVATILVVAQHGLVGSAMMSPVDVSYLADCVVLLRYFELSGEIRKAVSVVKKRSGAHEKAIRPFVISAEGLMVGPPLTEFHGVLSGTPLLDANLATLMSFGERIAPGKSQ